MPTDRRPILSLVPPRVRIALAVFAVALAPLCFLGAGTDLDAGAVLVSGDRIVHGGYVASRAPGAPVHEALVGVLDLLGDWAPNALSLLAAVALLAAVGVLLTREGVPRPWLAAAFVGASPWFQVASSSTVDFVLAAALFASGAVALRNRHVVLAGVLCGLSIGTRMSGVLLVVALVVAEATGRGDERPAALRRALRTAAIAGAVGVLAFLPPFFAADDSLSFARNDFTTSTPANHLGRFLVKNLAYVGPLAAVLIVVALPALWQLRRVAGERFVVRFAAVGFVLEEALFLRFPWKLGHLLPAMVCLALLLVEALRDRPRLLLAIVVAQLSLGVVNVELVRPDVPNAATRGTFDVRVRPGPLVVDAQCRADDPDAARSIDLVRIEAAWNCARPFGTGR